MRGKVDRQGDVFHVFDLEDLVSSEHPLRAIKSRADRILAGMVEQFDQA